jgi:hypothetical protein
MLKWKGEKITTDKKILIWKHWCLKTVWVEKWAVIELRIREKKTFYTFQLPVCCFCVSGVYLSQFYGFYTHWLLFDTPSSSSTYNEGLNKRNKPKGLEHGGFLTFKTYLKKTFRIMFLRAFSALRCIFGELTTNLVSKVSILTKIMFGIFDLGSSHIKLAYFLTLKIFWLTKEKQLLSFKYFW